MSVSNLVASPALYVDTGSHHKVLFMSRVPGTLLIHTRRNLQHYVVLEGLNPDTIKKILDDISKEWPAHSSLPEKYIQKI